MRRDAGYQKRRMMLQSVERKTEAPLMFLGILWLVLVIIDLLNRSTRLLEVLGIIIWVIFILDFILRFSLSPSKQKYLRDNVITLISLIIPVFRLLRIFRVLRLFRFTRGLRLFKVIGSINRGMNALASVMSRRKFGYVLLLTLFVILVGSAGMYAFERNAGKGFSSYGDSIWWTSMIVTTMGSEYWPRTTEGRILGFIISLYGFAVFGYFTAVLASFFIGRESDDKAGPMTGSKEINELREEVRKLTRTLQDKSKDAS